MPLNKLPARARPSWASGSFFTDLAKEGIEYPVRTGGDVTAIDIIKDGKSGESIGMYKKHFLIQTSSQRFFRIRNGVSGHNGMALSEERFMMRKGKPNDQI